MTKTILTAFLIIQDSWNFVLKVLLFYTGCIKKKQGLSVIYVMCNQALFHLIKKKGLNMYKFKLYQRKRKGSYLKQTIYSNKTEYNNTVSLIERLIEIGYISHSMNYNLLGSYIETIDESSLI